ncbi:VOC family protein [Cryobacterium psychrophilum]|uniref:VOC family protein n=1 Tax=Cryobacterium psychrophilum TaxID=41988 RepID=A0A4Y8KT70_9MICO|nr:VOC family protein [Cryobacterium psychrophilum]TDW28703.1 catechol 2,3-dioxygenase [Cryobacterium psychrophilum]TFD82362.1 VOC family protein [Cryobacterium psychrophilum]
MTQPTTRSGEDLLAAETGMDAVGLRVGDLALMSSYYRDALGLETLSERGSSVVLGRGLTPLVVLEHASGLPVSSRSQAGLFHTALLFDTRAALAATVYQASRDRRSSFAGSADHLVSEAFYFTDPEGNGIELYVDRDRSEWVYRNGRIEMQTLALDPNRYLRENLQGSGDAAPNSQAKVGHVHLQVGDVATARAFYVDALGFEITAELPGALFVSAGGYHHHMAMNTWNSRGAGPRAASLGLAEVAITVPTRADLDALSERLRHRSIPVQDDGNRLRVDDPWSTPVTLSVGEASASH